MSLPVTEELDFAYLLELMPPLYSIPEYSLLPELFSIIGHEKLIQLCQYAGGKTIKIPTLNQLTNSLTALQWFYDIYIKHTKCLTDMDDNIEVRDLVVRIAEVYNAKHNL